jgi:hypothetical protein
MKLTRSNLLIAIMALIIAALSYALVFFARDEIKPVGKHEKEKILPKSAVGSKEGFVTLSLSKDSQRASGIATVELVDADNKESAEIYGLVLSPQPLFELRAQYLAALAEARTQRITVSNSDNEYQRLKRLYSDDRNISERALLAAETQWRSEQAKLTAAEQAASTLKEKLRAVWGDTVTNWTADPHSKVFDNLSTQREMFVQVTLPFELRQSVSKRPLKISPVGASEGMRTARYVSVSQQQDAAMPGATFLYLAEGKDLRVGMRVRGRLDLGGEEREGVLIPQAAVVWHGGKAWCYVQDGDQEFVRREVSTKEELPGGWFNAEGFEAGERVVVRGAQLLLSEEQKFQIREENDD